LGSVLRLRFDSARSGIFRACALDFDAARLYFFALRQSDAQDTVLYSALALSPVTVCGKVKERVKEP
jgi:hypothetical protein